MRDYVIRNSIVNARPCLTVWRKRERTFDAGARAYLTKSGAWIVSYRNQCSDVARDEAEARARRLLTEYVDPAVTWK